MPSAVSVGPLDRTLEKIEKIHDEGTRVRILQLGDSHIAADYITGMIRYRLQKKFGDGGRGFMHPDQPSKFGGRRLRRTDSDWDRYRVVDENGRGRSFGFSGISIESRRKGAEAIYRVEPQDHRVRIYYQAHPRGAGLTLRLNGQAVKRVRTRAVKREARVEDAAVTASGRE